MQTEFTYKETVACFNLSEAYLNKKETLTVWRPTYIFYTVIQLGKLFMMEIYYEKLEPHFEEDNIQLHYVDMNSFNFSIKPDPYRRFITVERDVLFLVAWAKNLVVKQN